MKNVISIVLIFIAGFIVHGYYSNGNEEVATAVSETIEKSEQDDYFIQVYANPVSEYVVSLKVNTNLPVPVDVMASLSVKGQAPSDTYIGISKRVSLKSSDQIIKIDGASEILPSGEYIAKVNFYPRWGAENGTDQAKSITQEVAGADDVVLRGSGESIAQANQRNSARKWVMESVSVGTPWNENQFVERMGQFERSASTLNLHDAYYFPETDMTIIVSRVKDSVAMWRLGKASQ